MKRFALNNLISLAVVLLASICTSNTACFGDTITIVNKSNQKIHVAYARTEGATDGLVSNQSGSFGAYVYNCTQDVVRGWRHIPPHSSETIWKGNGSFCVYIEYDDGSRSTFSHYDTRYFWIHDSAFFSSTIEERRSGIVIHAIIEGSVETFDDYYWGKGNRYSKNFFLENGKYGSKSFNNAITIQNSLNSVHKSNNVKHNTDWLERQLRDNDWYKAKFYQVPSDVGTLNIGG